MMWGRKREQQQRKNVARIERAKAEAELARSFDEFVQEYEDKSRAWNKLYEHAEPVAPKFAYDIRLYHGEHGYMLLTPRGYLRSQCGCPLVFPSRETAIATAQAWWG